LSAALTAIQSQLYMCNSGQQPAATWGLFDLGPVDGSGLGPLLVLLGSADGGGSGALAVL
jgi:hypothetical protein